MALRLLVLCLYITLCLGQFGIQDYKQKVCLYSAASTQVLKPLQLFDTNCPNNKTYCMNAVYKYSNFQYNGVAALKPVAGEIVMFLSQDEAGRLDFVTFLNANVDTTLKVWTQVTGADPTNILLYDDPAPSDTWLWNPATNTGNFSWTTKPGFTDGVIIGHINFVDNYCLRSSFIQPNNAIQKISIMSGTINNPQRILTVNYASGTIFEFCQYPRTAITHTDATCPGRSDGSAAIGIVFGPSSVQYKWFSASGVLVSSSATATNLRAGTYTVIVNDTSSNGCTAERTVIIAEPTVPSASVTTSNFTCVSRGSASATAAGGSGSGFTYQWFKASGAPVGSGQTISNLMPGNYYVVVTDSCGSTTNTSFSIATIGCCGDAICQANEVCGSSNFCASDCGQCCPPGTYVASSGCKACPAGSRSTTYQAASCDSCAANTFNAGGAEPCAPCPVNTFSQAGAGKCLHCAAGQVRDTNEPTCRSCGDGSFANPCDNSQCSQCEAGTYSVDGASTCQSCAPGSFSAAGASSCSTCSSNTYSGAGAASCSSCPGSTQTIGGGATHILACN